MTIDPVADLALRWALAAIFALAALHKLRDRPTFEGQLAAYALLPEGLVHPASRAIPLIEGAAALFLAARSEHAAMLAAFLLAAYAGAIGINLARGRTEIDCGCGGPEGRQTLHPGLVLRNIALTLCALATGLPLLPRALAFADYAVAALAALAIFALHAAFNALLANMRAHRRLKA